MKSPFNFAITKKDSQSYARTGELDCPNGKIMTPAFVTVGTKATVKSLKPSDIEANNIQFMFVNTYHLALSPGLKVLKEIGGVHAFSMIKAPLISDSGGFQVFSLARDKKFGENSVSKTVKDDVEQPPHIVKINEDGVKFRSPVDGKEYFFTPEFSIKAQQIIGADFIVAFDECAAANADEKYTRKAMERTHRWAVRSLEAMKLRITNDQLRINPSDKKFVIRNSSSVIEQRMFGVIQGGKFENLRKESATYISSLPFFGLAIGGVSVGETKEQMREQVEWIMEVIKDDERPRHLLGVGEIDDIFSAVELGMDTMDCVTATRHARMGILYDYNAIDTKRRHEIDITKSKYAEDYNPVSQCKCYTCQNFTRSYLYHLFKQRELLAYHLATIHNTYFMEDLFSQIRGAIQNGKFQELKNKWV